MSSEDDWEADLASRVARALPEHTTRGFFLQSYMEQLRALGDEALLGQALALCGHGPIMEFFNYPVSSQLRVLALLMPSLVARHGSASAALRVLGRQGVSRFLSSTAGSMLLKLSGQGPKRIVGHAPIGYRMSSSVGEHSLVWQGPRSGRWTMREQFLPPAFHEGLLLELLDRGGAHAPRVVSRVRGLMDFEFDLSWEDPPVG
ncbi:TIGR02265 family protein [Melittangium boletus]|uniref:TIGR02265 family protein n=1 Tax=Melittangium boletus TaxID=83453 RepID=UPI003DA34A51